MKTIVTGGAGFIGSHLVRALLKNGHEVLVIDDLSTGRQSNLPTSKYLEFMYGDLSKNDSLEKMYWADLGKVNIVYHLAADSIIQTDSLHSYLRNVLGTVNLLKYMLENDVKTMVFSSSATVYGEQTHTRIDEQSPLSPICFYGASKLAIENLLSTSVKKNDLRSWIYRFGNVVGARMRHGVIYDFLQQIRAYGEIRMRGDGSQIRSFVHIDDVVNALTASESRQCGTYNVASDDTIDVQTVADIIQEILEISELHIKFEERWQGDVDFSFPDNRKLEASGWRPTMNSAEAVEVATRVLAKEIDGIRLAYKGVDTAGYP